MGRLGLVSRLGLVRLARGRLVSRLVGGTTLGTSDHCRLYNNVDEILTNKIIIKRQVKILLMDWLEFFCVILCVWPAYGLAYLTLTRYSQGSDAIQDVISRVGNLLPTLLDIVDRAVKPHVQPIQPQVESKTGSSTKRSPKPCPVSPKFVC